MSSNETSVACAMVLSLPHMELKKKRNCQASALRDARNVYFLALSFFQTV